MSNIIAVLGIVLVVMLAIQGGQDKPAPSPPCTVNQSLLSLVQDYQSESTAAAQNLRQMITMLPRNEQEVIAERAESSSKIASLEKKVSEAKASCPQK